MVINENTSQYKHPGGHINLNESLIDGLKREIKEELDYNLNEKDLGAYFFDNVHISENIMINVYFQMEVSDERLEILLSNSVLPTKLLRLDELNLDNSWESEIRAIKYLRELK